MPPPPPYRQKSDVKWNFQILNFLAMSWSRSQSTRYSSKRTYIRPDRIRIGWSRNSQCRRPPNASAGGRSTWADLHYRLRRCLSISHLQRRVAWDPVSRHTDRVVYCNSRWTHTECAASAWWDCVCWWSTCWLQRRKGEVSESLNEEDHALILLTEIGASPTGNGEHLPLDQRRLGTLVGQANGHDEVCEGYGMLQTYNGNVVVLVVGVLLVFRMHMYVLEGNVQRSIRTAQIVGFLNAVGLRLHIELAQAHVFAGSKSQFINLVRGGTQ